jgi:hypothetical protein
MIEHKEVIQAWLDGKEIEYKICEGSDWFPIVQYVNPISSPQYEWRVKPTTRTIEIPSVAKLCNVNAYFDEDKMQIVVEYEELQ